MSWTNFEHRIWKQLKAFSLEEKDSFVLAISGGVDSMVLLHAFLELKPQAKIVVAHYHHGPSERLDVVNYREQAYQLVQKVCAEKKLVFISDKSEEMLRTENDFREKRFLFLNKVQQQYPESVLATAHHKDDMLETWLLKMLRGTGPESLQNFKFWNQKILRPLLDFTKEDLLVYAKEKRLTWIDDPTNQENDYLRNWLRNEWLSSLSQKIPGSLVNLSESLSRLISEVDPNNEASLVNFQFDEKNNPTKGWLLRSDFLTLGHSERLKVLASLLKGLGQCDFSQGQLEEVVKRLDKNQKDLIFSVAGVKWFINAQQIVVELQ